jgi:probable phosphoglycerate mutase
MMRAQAGTKLSRAPARGGPTALLDRARGALTERRPPRRGRRALNEPSSLWLLRHGQSEGNVIRDRAAPDLHTLDIAERDMDVPLSALGRAQAEAFGRWLAGRRPEAPQVVVASPYRRAADTARVALEAAGLDLRVHLDERLRERELGTLDLLTRAGVTARFPDEQRRRDRLGKFYYRPPGGESWVDVALRLRSLRDTLGREHPGRRVLVVTHEVVILMMRYLLEELDEQTVLAMGGGQLANCSVTAYETDGRGRPQLRTVDWTAPLEAADTPVTRAVEAPVAPR